MNIFVICVLQVSWHRLIQPVEVYTNWYMMCYLKKDMFCKKPILFDWCIIFWMVCPSSFSWFVWPLSVIIQQNHSTWILFMHSVHAFIRTLILTIVHAIMWAIMWMIVWAIIFDWFRVWAPTLAVQSFCGSRVQFPGPDWHFRPIVCLAYVSYFLSIIWFIMNSYYMSSICQQPYYSEFPNKTDMFFSFKSLVQKCVCFLCVAFHSLVLCFNSCMTVYHWDAIQGCSCLVLYFKILRITHYDSFLFLWCRLSIPFF